MAHGSALVSQGPLHMTIAVSKEGIPSPRLAQEGAKKAMELLRTLADLLSVIKRRSDTIKRVQGLPSIVQRMIHATQQMEDPSLTPLAAVAGAVSDEVANFLEARDGSRIIVNNGGDIALRLRPDETIKVGARSASEVAMICGLLGVVVSAIATSGLAIKLPLAIEDLSLGILPIALFIAGLSSMLLGIGVPTPAAYMLVAVGAVPSLLKMGVPLLPAHLFCFVFAVCSHITPPVAIGALVASKIAGADYWKTSWEAVKAAFAKYLLPFFFIYAPVILLRPDAGFVPSLLQIVAILVVIFSLQIAVSNYCFTHLRLDETIGFIIASVLSLAAVFTKGELLFLIGLALFVASTARQFVIRRRLKIQTGGAPFRAFTD